MKRCTNEHCTDGKIFDVATFQFEDCPFCLEIKQKEIENGVYTEDGKVLGLSEILGFRRIFSRLVLEPSKLFGDYAYTHMDKSSVDPMVDSLNAILSSLSNGGSPKASILCYLGSKGDVEYLGYLLLAVAYKSNLSVHPLVTPFTLRGIKQKYEEYKELIDTEVVVATFTPSIKEDSYLIEDLIKERAYRGKATFVVLSDGIGLNSLIQRLCSFEGYSSHQPLYMGIPYNPKKDTDEKKLARINKAIKNGNSYLKTNTPLLELEDIQKTKQQSKAPNLPVIDSRGNSLF